MDIHELLDPLLQKLTKESKKMFFMGDFNVDLLKINSNKKVAHFLELFSSHLFVPHIVQATHICKNKRNQVISKTLIIDNIFSNSLNFSDGISGNLTVAISDHLAQFLIIPIEVSKKSDMFNCFKRDTKNFDKESFILDMLDVNWNELTQTDKNNPNLSFNFFEEKLMKIIDSYMPLKKMTKSELKRKRKPWITQGILISIKQRDKLYKKFIKAKDIEIKNNYHSQFKNMRNLIVQLIRNSKKNHFQNYFHQNLNNIRNTWKGIKNIISINNNNKNKNNPTSLLIVY